MGATHFKIKTLKHVATEMALHVLAYNIKRVLAIVGVRDLLKAIAAFLLSLTSLRTAFRRLEDAFWQRNGADWRTTAVAQ
jgi:hypothetical protein